MRKFENSAFINYDPPLWFRYFKLLTMTFHRAQIQEHH